MHQKCALEVNPIGPTRQPARESAEAEHARKTYSKRRKPSGVDDATKRNFHDLRVISERVFPFFLAGRQISSALTGKSRVRKTLGEKSSRCEGCAGGQSSLSRFRHPRSTSLFRSGHSTDGLVEIWNKNSYGRLRPMSFSRTCLAMVCSQRRWCADPPSPYATHFLPFVLLGQRRRAD